MQVKLKVLGRSSKVIVNSGIRTSSKEGSRFIIGSGEDCYLRCQSTQVSPRHCVIAVRGNRAVVRDWESEQGVFVNGQRIDNDTPLHHGDRLRVGDVEFKVMTISAQQHTEPHPTPNQETSHALGDKPVSGPTDRLDEDHSESEEIIDWLLSADELDRKQKIANPELRRFQLLDVAPSKKEKAASDQDANAGGDRSPVEVNETEASETSREKEPKKLPKPAAASGANSYEVAANVLGQRYGGSLSKVIKRKQ